MDLPILLGMNNPLSDDPKWALYPDPPGCAGHRLCNFLGMGEILYLSAFERRNLLNARTWKKVFASEVAETLRPELTTRRVVFLGEEVSNCFDHADPHFVWRSTPEGGRWAKLPHPSGRCRFWNEPIYRAAASVFLQELVAETHSG